MLSAHREPRPCSQVAEVRCAARPRATTGDVRGGQVITHIAGIHALGSIAAAQYRAEHVAELYAAHPDESFCMAVDAEFDALTPTSVDVLIPPCAWA